VNRTEALSWLQANGFNTLMQHVERTTDDTSTGYAPALDRAFAIYGRAHGMPPPYTSITTSDSEDECFTALLRAVTYDLVITGAAALVDTSVDAPLTSTKFSQLFKQLGALRDEAWRMAAICGYESIHDRMRGHVFDLGFLEPPDDQETVT
jgi:hypothetical protein